MSHYVCVLKPVDLTHMPAVTISKDLHHECSKHEKQNISDCHRLPIYIMVDHFLITSSAASGDQSTTAIQA